MSERRQQEDSNPLDDENNKAHPIPRPDVPESHTHHAKVSGVDQSSQKNRPSKSKQHPWTSKHRDFSRRSKTKEHSPRRSSRDGDHKSRSSQSKSRRDKSGVDRSVRSDESLRASSTFDSRGITSSKRGRNPERSNRIMDSSNNIQQSHHDGSDTERRNDDEDSSSQDSVKSLGASNKTGLTVGSTESLSESRRMAKSAREDHEANRESVRRSHHVPSRRLTDYKRSPRHHGRASIKKRLTDYERSPTKHQDERASIKKRLKDYERSPRQHERASIKKKERRSTNKGTMIRPGAENVSSTAGDKRMSKNEQRRNMNRVRRQEVAARRRRRRQRASAPGVVTADDDEEEEETTTNDEVIRRQVQAAIAIELPEATVGIDDSDVDSDAKRKRKRKRNRSLCTAPMLCLLALLLIVIGGGAIAYIILADPLNPGNNPPDPIYETPSGSPTAFALKMPSDETLIFGRPSEEDCEAIRKGQDVDGQEVMDVLEYDISVEVILDEEGNYNGTMTSLVAEVREVLLPSLVGCTDSLSQRKLGHTTTREDDNSRHLLPKSRQLEDAQYPIINARVSGAYDSEASCRDDVVGDCRVGKLALEIFTKGQGQESAVEDIIDDVFGINDPSQSLGNKLELVKGSVLDIRIWKLDNANPSNGGPANSAPSSVGAPSADPSAVPSLSPSITSNGGPANGAPSSVGAPSADPSAVPSLSPSITSPGNNPGPALGPIGPTITAGPTLSPSTATPAPSTIPTALPTKQPSTIPTLGPSTPSSDPSSSPTAAAPSKVPTDAPSLSPSSAPSSTPSSTPTTPKPSVVPSGLPSRSPSVAPSSTPSSSPTIPKPSAAPSKIPTKMPSRLPSGVPSRTPSKVPTTPAPVTTCSGYYCP